MSELDHKDFIVQIGNEDQKLKELEFSFTQEMRNLYSRSRKDINYISTYFLRSVDKRGGRNAAKEMIKRGRTNKNVERFMKVTKHSNKNLIAYTVEYLILNNPQYHVLFTSEEIEECVNRLEKWSKQQQAY